jgi:hypothetical protein
MLRNDGLKIPVQTHVYGRPENEYSHIDDENTYVATFLMKYGCDKHVVDNYFRVYFAELVNRGFAIEDYVEGLPYNAVFDGFNSELLELWDTYKDKMRASTVTQDEIIGANRAVNQELNQTFTRVRIGGEYDSVPGNNDIYFRIGSAGFRWNKIIDDFLATRDSQHVETITIERDPESTGSHKAYTTRKGVPIDHLDRNSYFNESKDNGVDDLNDEFKSMKFTNHSVCSYGPRMVLRAALFQGLSMNQIVELLSEKICDLPVDVIYNEYTKVAVKESRSPVY